LSRLFVSILRVLLPQVLGRDSCPAFHQWESSIFIAGLQEKSRPDYAALFLAVFYASLP